MKLGTTFAALLAIHAAAPSATHAQPRVDGLVWGGNVAGGSWYLRDTPSYTGQPCYYIESNRANWGWGGASSTYGASVTRGNTRGDNGQAGSGQATSGFFDFLTITAPGIPNGANGSVTFNINIATQYSPTVTFNPEWHHLAGHIGLGVGIYGEWSSDVYSWEAYVYPGGLYRDFYESGPADPIPSSIPITFNFQFGTPFQISLFGRVFSIAEGSNPPEYFELYFENRLSWGGVAALTGPGGAVSGYTISAQSGADYTASGGVCGSSCGQSPTITGPQSTFACPGGQATLTVTALPPQPLSYQWRKNGTIIPGARSSSLAITVNTPADTGSFDCLVTGGCSTVTSPAATVTMCAADADCNGHIEPADIAAFVNTWFASLQNQTLAGDFDGNGQIQPADIASFVNAWFAALTGGC